MAEIKLKYQTQANLTIQLYSLANGSARQSTVVDNTSNQYESGKVLVQVETTSSPTGDKAVYVYAYGNDGGSSYPDRVTGTDNPITMDNPHNLDFLGVISCPAASTQYRKTFDLAEVWPMGLPSKWGIVIKNATGYAFSSTPANNFVSFQAITHQSV